MKIDRRIRALEARFASDRVVIYLADGSARELLGRTGFLLDLFCDACRGDLTSAQREQLELVRESVDADEPGGARLAEVLRCFLRPATESLPNSPDAGTVAAETSSQ
jgi:hypothetical protein